MFLENPGLVFDLARARMVLFDSAGGKNDELTRVARRCLGVASCEILKRNHEQAIAEWDDAY